MNVSSKTVLVTLALVACGAAGESAESASRTGGSSAGVGTAAGAEGWTGTFGGHAAGSYSGPIAIASVGRGAIMHVQLYSSADASPYVAVTISPFGTGVTRGGGEQVAAEAIFAKGPDLYAAIASGEASSLESGRPGDERFPSPATLMIESISGDWVVGTLQAEFWQAKPDGNPSARAAVEIAFTARACQQGTPEFTTCTKPQE